jgi:hypothetical protein
MIFIGLDKKPQSDTRDSVSLIPKTSFALPNDSDADASKSGRRRYHSTSS